MDYRTDARPTCAACGLAFAADDLALDDQGRPRCAACTAAAGASALERRAVASRADDRRRRTWMLAGALALASVVAVGLGVSHVKQRERLDTQEAIGDTLDRLSSRFAVYDFDRPRVQPCADGQLASRAPGETQPWATFNPSTRRWGGTRSKGAARLLDARSWEEASKVVRELSNARYFVVLLETTSGPNDWHGSVVVVRFDDGEPLCWAKLDLGEPMTRNLVVDAALVRAGADEALAKISGVLKLGE